MDRERGDDVITEQWLLAQGQKIICYQDMAPVDFANLPEWQKHRLVELWNELAGYPTDQIRLIRPTLLRHESCRG